MTARAARPAIAPALSAAWRHTRMARAELRAWQDARLRRLVLHAYDAVPLYRRLFDLHRLHPRHIRGTADLDLIPFTDKAEMLRQGPAGVLARGHDPAALLAVQARGLSGEPLTIRRTWLEDKLQSILRLRTFGGLGLRQRDRIVVVAGRPAGEQMVSGGSLHALGLQRRQVIDGFQEPARLASRLLEARPDVVVGPPGLLDRLTGPESADAVRRVRPRLVIVGGEVAAPGVRLRIREAFAASLHEVYTSHECPLIAWECRHSGDLHTCDESVLVEVLRDDRPAGPGERGDVVVTNLHSYAMPFIRYRLEDLAIRGAPCDCGAPFSAIREIQRRPLGRLGA